MHWFWVRFCPFKCELTLLLQNRDLFSHRSSLSHHKSCIRSQPEGCMICLGLCFVSFLCWWYVCQSLIVQWVSETRHGARWFTKEQSLPHISMARFAYSFGHMSHANQIHIPVYFPTTLKSYVWLSQKGQGLLNPPCQTVTMCQLMPRTHVCMWTAKSGWKAESSVHHRSCWRQFSGLTLAPQRLFVDAHETTKGPFLDLQKG